MSDELAVLLILLLICGWFAFCKVMNHWATTPPVPAKTDPVAEDRAALTAPQPMPTGRHRTPASPLPPYAYRPTTTGAHHHA